MTGGGPPSGNPVSGGILATAAQDATPVPKPNPPMNLFKPAAPFKARVLSNVKLSLEGTDDDIRHVVIDYSGSGYHFIEGQSMGVIAPGEREPGKPHKVRLYSIASGRDGALVEGKHQKDTAALCVKRLVYDHDETGVRTYGVCSNHICDLQPGETVDITGPNGKAFVIPEDNATDLILFATGTGIAPFRGFFQRLYETSPEPYAGRIALFYGAKTRKELAYLNDADESLAHFQRDFHVDIFTALSRENPGQPKVYVQHRLGEQRALVEEIFQRANFSIYICGLKGMDTGIEAVFSEMCGGDEAWKEVRQKLKKAGRYNLEVY